MSEVLGEYLGLVGFGWSDVVSVGYQRVSLLFFRRKDLL
jgi:hypothetical protein